MLPARQVAGWHTAGTVLAGSTGRRRRGPTLSALDLRRIIDAAAGTGPLYRDVRNAALVALACFSGLRAEEIVALRWEDLSTELTPSGYYGLTATLGRRGRHQPLPIPAPAAEALSALARRLDGAIESLAGPVLRAGDRSERALSYRAAHSIIRDACLRYGLRPVESVELRAACAYWLRTQGLSDHEVAAVLGLARVRSLDRLRSRHAALDAQRRVWETCHA